MSGNYGWNPNLVLTKIDGSVENQAIGEDGPPVVYRAGCCGCSCCSSDEDSLQTVTYPPQQQQPSTNDSGHFWVDGGSGLHPLAVRAGIDKDGSPIYVGRALHAGEVLPAKVLPNRSCATVSWDGAEHIKYVYEILCRGEKTVIWQQSQHGEIPDNAVQVGTTGEGEALYVGRVFHDGTQTPGKVHPSHGNCYIPYNGEELAFDEYEILILQ